MDELSKLVQDLVQKFPKHEDFLNEVEKWETTEEKKGDFFLDIGDRLFRFSNFKLALEIWNKALDFYIKYKDKLKESECHRNLGEAYRNLSDFKKAIEYQLKALEIAKDVADKTVESSCYRGLGITYCYLSDFKKAIEYFKKSMEISIEIGDKAGEAYCYGNLGAAYESLSDFKKAIEYQEKSLKIRLEIGDKAGEAYCYKRLGKVYDSLGDFERAVEFNEKALGIIEEIGDVYHKKFCLGDMGKIYFDKNDFNSAEDYFKRAIEIIEGMRRENIPNEYKRNFWKDNILIFDNVIISDVRLGKREEALEYSERGKGRTISDFIMGRGIEEKEFKPTPLSFKEIQELALRIQKNLVLLRVTKKGTYAFTVNPEGEFDFLEMPEFNTKRLEELTVKTKADKPIGGWVNAYSNYKSAQDKACQLLLQKKYNEASKIIKEGETNWFNTMDDTLKVLYNELLGKVFSRFKKGEKIVIVPNRALNILPLHSCFYEREVGSIEERAESSQRKRHYLLEDYEISYAPNCNILDLCFKRETEGQKEERRKENFFAIANPTPPYELIFSEWEVEEIAKLFRDKEVFIRQEAKDAFMAKTDSYGIIHLSCHGVYDLGSSFNSRLSLGNEVNLILEEIFDKVTINNSWLVCLSACETGLTDYRDIADEFIGLQAGFLYAGAPTVIASLWSVSDYTTSLVMIKTYENIFKQGLNKAEALRKAQLWLKELTAGEALELIKSKELELEYSVRMAREDITPLRRAISLEDPKSKPFAHPYYWAGFQIFGA